MTWKVEWKRICARNGKHESESETVSNWLCLGTAILTVVMMAIPGIAQVPASGTFTTLHNFAGASAGDGAEPGYGPLAQGVDGNLYGTTTHGGVTCSFFGTVGCGEVFKITTGGAISQVYSFCPVGSCADGDRPEGGLALNINGNLYGTTDLGGTGSGNVFRVTPAGVLASTHNFSGSDGGAPFNTLIRANGSFYGTTQTGTMSGGTVFRISAGGVLATLANLTNTTGDLQGDPAALVQGTDGNFYGVAIGGGSVGWGTVFKMTPGGAISVLHNFTGNPDGRGPTGTLVQGTDGSFYGTTVNGGTTDNGTVFKITPGGVISIIYNFCTVNGCPDGFGPRGGLVAGTDGDFYGTTLGGGTGGAPGTIFQISPAGVLNILHSFHGLSDGSEPFAGLVQHTDGNFYGTTNAGGANSLGTVFCMSLGFKPFLELMTTSGVVSNTVIILGTGLTGTSNVSFGNTAAAFKVVSDSEITATVPIGATTGSVTAITGTETFTSNSTYHVKPTITGFAPPSGPVGTVVTINGMSLTQTSKVKFNGKAAAFSVNSDTQITSTVPVGAVTGKINVTTTGGSVTSASSFTVTP